MCVICALKSHDTAKWDRLTEAAAIVVSILNAEKLSPTEKAIAMQMAGDMIESSVGPMSADDAAEIKQLIATTEKYYAETGKVMGENTIEFLEGLRKALVIGATPAESETVH